MKRYKLVTPEKYSLSFNKDFKRRTFSVYSVSMKKIISILLFFILLDTSRADVPTDPCERALQLACSNELLEGPTGQSSGGTSGPVAYESIKRSFATSIRQSLDEISQSIRWKTFLETFEQVTRFNQHLTFQDVEATNLAIEACSTDNTSESCRKAVVEVFVSEVLFSAFATTDLMFQSQTLRIKRKGEIMSVSFKSLTRPITEEEMSKIPIGTIINTQITIDLWRNDESGLKVAYLEAMNQSLPLMTPPIASLNRLQNEIVPEVQTLLMAFLEEGQQTSLIQRLTRTVDNIVYTPPTLISSFETSAEGLQDLPLNFVTPLVPNAVYKAFDNEFEVYPGFITANTSVFGQFFIVAHEMGHAVDPCLIEYFLADEGYWNQTVLDEALRALASVGLTKNELFFLNMQNQIKCTSGSELGETTADVIAAELLGRFLNQNWRHLDTEDRIKAVAQSFRPFRCDLEKPPESFDPHLNVRDRYQEIILKNEEIRSFLQCQ